MYKFVLLFPLTLALRLSQPNQTSLSILQQGIEQVQNQIFTLSQSSKDSFSQLNEKIKQTIDSNVIAFMAQIEQAISQKNSQLLECQNELYELDYIYSAYKRPCMEYPLCAQCSLDPECIWCESSNQCLSGDQDGSFQIQCNKFLYQECPYQGCQKYQKCANCIDSPQCQWCENFQFCFEGSPDDKELPCDYFYLYSRVSKGKDMCPESSESNENHSLKVIEVEKQKKRKQIKDRQNQYNEDIENLQNVKNQLGLLMKDSRVQITPDVNQIQVQNISELVAQLQTQEANEYRSLLNDKLQQYGKDALKTVQESLDLDRMAKEMIVDQYTSNIIDLISDFKLQLELDINQQLQEAQNQILVDQAKDKVQQEIRQTNETISQQNIDQLEQQQGQQEFDIQDKDLIMGLDAFLPDDPFARTQVEVQAEIQKKQDIRNLIQQLKISPTKNQDTIPTEGLSPEDKEKRQEEEEQKIQENQDLIDAYLLKVDEEGADLDALQKEVESMIEEMHKTTLE